MTTVKIRKSDKGYEGFTCMGHAGYAKRGKPDILCSAISALVVNTINVLEDLRGEELDVETNEETGLIRCDFRKPLSAESVILMDAMVYGLQNISRTYGEKFLFVKIEEV